MKTPTRSTKILYWVSTVALVLFLLPGLFFAGSPDAIEGTKHLGMPMWFHWMLSYAKPIGGLLLIVPKIPLRLREWAYVALGIDFFAALYGHLATDALQGFWYVPVVTVVFLLVSYVTFHKMYKVYAND